jgi:hypothetical protein
MNQNKISHNIFADAEASKIITDQLCFSSGYVKGYIQEIGIII